MLITFSNKFSQLIWQSAIFRQIITPLDAWQRINCCYQLTWNESSYKVYLWWRIIIPSTVWRRIRRPLSWRLTRDCGRSFYGIVLRTSQGTRDRIRGLTSRARDIGMPARAAKWGTWKCLHVRSFPYNKWEDRICGHINEGNKTIKTGATLAAALTCVCWIIPKIKS